MTKLKLASWKYLNKKAPPLYFSETEMGYYCGRKHKLFP